MRIYKRFLALLAAAALLCALGAAGPTALAHEAVDFSQKGSIALEMRYENAAVPGGAITLYRVGSVQQDNGDFTFALTEAFAGSGASLTEVDDPQLAASLAAYAAQQGLVGVTQPINGAGEVAFENLELGLYLLVQTTPAEGYSAATPFLVSVPMEEGGHYLYAVNASPKVQLEKPAAPPAVDPPAGEQVGPTLPQTGQLNWPVPVLAVLGLLLFALGWALRFGKKRGGYAA